MALSVLVLCPIELSELSIAQRNWICGTMTRCWLRDDLLPWLTPDKIAVTVEMEALTALANSLGQWAFGALLIADLTSTSTEIVALELPIFQAQLRIGSWRKKLRVGDIVGLSHDAMNKYGRNIDATLLENETSESSLTKWSLLATWKCFFMQLKSKFTRKTGDLVEIPRGGGETLLPSPRLEAIKENGSAAESCPDETKDFPSPSKTQMGIPATQDLHEDAFRSYFGHARQVQAQNLKFVSFRRGLLPDHAPHFAYSSRAALISSLDEEAMDDEAELYVIAGTKGLPYSRGGCTYNRMCSYSREGYVVGHGCENMHEQVTQVMSVTHSCNDQHLALGSLDVTGLCRSFISLSPKLKAA